MNIDAKIAEAKRLIDEAPDYHLPRIKRRKRDVFGHWSRAAEPIDVTVQYGCMRSGHLSRE